MKFNENLKNSAPFLVLFDVDSTLIDQEVIDELADQLGVKQQVADITESAMRGELDFSESLTKRVALLEGLTREAFLEVRQRITFTQGAVELIEAIHDRQGLAFAVSGGFNEVLGIIGPELGLDGWKANTLGGNETHLDGTVAGKIVDSAEKSRTLIELSEKFGIPLSRTIAVGDGANDIDMIQTAGLGVAFDAKPALAEAADVVVVNRDLKEVIPLLPEL